MFRNIILKLFQAIAGTKERFTLEQRLFHAVIAAGVILILITNIINIIVGNNILTTIIPTAFSIASAFCYYISRFRNEYKISVLLFLILLLFIMTPLLWFSRGGSAGGFQFFILLFSLVLSAITRGKAGIYTLILYIITTIVMLMVEYYHPEFVIGYDSRSDRYFDVASGMTISMIMSVILFIVYVNAYDREKKMAGKYSAELEKERNSLNDKFETMNLELNMARSIQRQFIGMKKNIPYIDYIYHPMAKLGGDFLHLFTFGNTDEIGIFISDVSGHGVPGALITGMIYSHLLEITPRTRNPAQVLKSLNGVLFGNTGGNFITAIYGIYIPSKREFVYSNAGHNTPYIVKDRSCFFMEDKGRSLPLAVLSNSDLEDMKKPYRLSSTKLDSGTKILLYTDGLTDTVNIHSTDYNSGQEDFENTYLPEIISELIPMTPQEFLYALMERLKLFRGGEEFDDDICMVCVDIR